MIMVDMKQPTGCGVFLCCRTIDGEDELLFHVCGCFDNRLVDISGRTTTMRLHTTPPSRLLQFLLRASYRYRRLSSCCLASLSSRSSADSFSLTSARLAACLRRLSSLFFGFRRHFSIRNTLGLSIIIPSLELVLSFCVIWTVVGSQTFVKTMDCAHQGIMPGKSLAERGRDAESMLIALPVTIS